MKKIILLLLLTNISSIIYAETKIAWVDNLRIRDYPGLHTKSIGKLKKGEIVKIVTGAGEVAKIKLRGRDRLGYWQKIQKGSLTGYVFSGGLRSYYSYNNYIIAMNDRAIVVKNKETIMQTIPVSNIVDDFYIIKKDDLFLINTYYNYMDEENLEPATTQLIVFNYKIKEIEAVFNGYFSTIDISPDKNFIILLEENPKNCSLPLLYKGTLFSRKTRKIILQFEITSDGKWVSDTKYETEMDAGNKVPGKPKASHGKTYLQKIIIESNSVIKKSEYREVYKEQ